MASLNNVETYIQARKAQHDQHRAGLVRQYNEIQTKLHKDNTILQNAANAHYEIAFQVQADRQRLYDKVCPPVVFSTFSPADRTSIERGDKEI